MSEEQVPQDALPEDDQAEAAAEDQAAEAEAAEDQPSLEDRVSALEATVGRRPAFVEEQAEDQAGDDDSPAPA